MTLEVWKESEQIWLWDWTRVSRGVVAHGVKNVSQQPRWADSNLYRAITRNYPNNAHYLK